MPTQPEYPAVTRYQWYIAFTATMGFALATMDTSFFTAALTPLSHDLGISAQTVGVLTVAFYVIAGLATYGVGLLMDVVGRRKAFQFTLFGTAIGSALTAVSSGVVALAVFRSIAQGSGSAEGATGQTLVAENSAPHRRGLLMAVQQVGYPIGWFLSTGLALIVIPAFGWRALFLVGVLPALLAIVARLWVRETDRFRDMRRLRRQARAPRTAARAEGSATHDAETTTRYSVDQEQAGQALLRQLFGRPLRRTSIVLFLATLFFAMGSGTVLFFIPYLGELRGLSSQHVNQIIAIGTAGGMIAYLVVGYLGDRVGRKWLIVSSLIVGAMGIYFLSQSTTYASFVAFELIFWVFYMGAYAALYGFITENYPTRVRGTGTGFVTAAVWLGNAICGGVFSALLEHVGVQGVFMIGGTAAGLISAILFALSKNLRPSAELETIAQ